MDLSTVEVFPTKASSQKFSLIAEYLYGHYPEFRPKTKARLLLVMHKTESNTCHINQIP